MIPPDVRLYTWVDVEEVIFRAQKEGAWPEWLVWVETYWNGLTIGVHPGKKDMVVEWLNEKFDPRFDKDNLRIKLESMANNPRYLNILFEETNESEKQRFRPSFSRPLVLRPLQEQERPSIQSEENLPAVVAFHSFKGGVGRTLHALAFALALTKKEGKGESSINNKRRVLLVDGDLEAPGLTWILPTRLPSPPVSFVDFLALVHGDTDPTASKSIDLVANRLKDALIDGIYILPAFRSSSKFTSLEIKPEHLIRGAEDPFILTNVLANLGKALNVDTVIVDLRAGLSELSAGLLLDPKVYRVLVTTLSGQSIEGTCQLLQLLGEIAPSKRTDDPLPALIVSQVLPEYLKKNLLYPYLERLDEASDDLKRKSEKELSEYWGIEGVPLVISNFDQNLLVLPDVWDEVIERIQKSNLSEEIATLIDWIPSTKSEKRSSEGYDAFQLKESRENLANYAKKLIYAETGEIQDFLTISPLRNLASNFKASVPIAVIVGAKGSGKTYTYIQIALRKNWKDFVKYFNLQDVSIDAYICPVLKSKNLKENAQEIVRKARENSSEKLQLSEPYNILTIEYYLRDRLKEGLHEGQWRDHWLDILSWSAGFEINQEGAGKKFVEYLRERDLHMVALIDGLEDLFQNLSSNENEQIAIRALLQEVPEWLEQQPSRPLGLLVFIRQDMVINAVKQNPAQLIARYDPYTLKWSTEEALRLVAWISMKVNVLNDSRLKSGYLQEMSKSELVDELVPLWGRKLGSENSREARSATWVITALSDLKGQIQARDVVRFLHIASKVSIKDSYWKDRILVPSAIKQAIGECSKEKREEIEKENIALKDIFQKLGELDFESKQIPFTREQTNLSLEDLKILENNGVILREEEYYYMPEIFRLGLDFKLKAGSRPRVLTLARRAQKWNK